VSSPATEAESDLKNANVSSHQIPQTVEETNSEELIGKYEKQVFSYIA
jgi:hypothetical protein